MRMEKLGKVKGEVIPFRNKPILRRIIEILEISLIN